MKKIYFFYPIIENGGVKKNFELIINFLVKKNKFDISIITFKKNNINNLSKKIKIISSSFTNLSNRRLRFIFCGLILIKKILTEKNAIIFSFQGNFYALIVSFLLKKKIIIRSNTSPVGWANNSFKNLFFKFLLKKSDVIIVNSKKFAKSLNKKFNVISSCIYNPIDENEIIKKSNIKKKISFFSKNTINFINVSRLEYQKNHETLIKAFKKLNNERCRLIILGSGQKYNFLKNLIKKFNLTNQIKLLTFKKNPFPYIKKSDVFILSSLFEGLPNVLLEALILNKFIISSNCPTGPSEILNNGKGGLLFKVKDENDLKKKILFYLNNKKKCLKKLSYAKKNLKRFDYKLNMKRYENIIEKLFHQ